MTDDFKGLKFKDANHWTLFIPQRSDPIRYLEIGVCCGYNVLSVEKLYGSHPNSILTCVDPWIDYSEYSEYKGVISSYHDMFMENTRDIQHKLDVRRDFSHRVLPTMADKTFDMIYIDGNHDGEYVLEDAVLAFRKVKIGGWLIFDDYHHPVVRKSIDEFINIYKHRLSSPSHAYWQVFIQRST
jgi:predicted O-methyltransferase YrrM